MIEQQIAEDMKTAMKEKDKQRLEAIRQIKAQILLAKTSGANQELTDADMMKILQKMVKQRKESAEIYAQQRRQDLADEENKQMAYIQAYLPAQMSEEEIAESVKKIVEQTGATSIKDMGKVMGAANKQLAGKAESAAIANAVKKLLSK